VGAAPALLDLGVDGPGDLVAGQQIGAAIENARRYREARQMAETDALTGFFNQRYFHETLRRESLRAQRYDRRLALVIVDLDDFKAVNDRHGHAVGDEVLVGIASLLRSRLRPRDSAGRIGGEEFLLLLPNTDADGARAVVDRLREAAAHCAPSAAQPALRVTFSAGVAAAAAGETVEALYARADQALYLAKAAGRDRCVVSSAPAGWPSSP